MKTIEQILEQSMVFDSSTARFKVLDKITKLESELNTLTNGKDTNS